MTQLIKRRLRLVESLLGEKSKEEEQQEASTQRELFFFVDLALKENPEWNALSQEQKWRLFTHQEQDKSELVILGLRNLKRAIDIERERRKALKHEGTS